MKVIIVDDEPLARERLRRFLSSEPDVEIVAECADGSSAAEAVNRHAPDLLLLDVQMPGIDGFETLRALNAERLPAVVFVTGFDQHAVRAFDARALDYLLKPTARARLAESLVRVRERLAAKDVSTRFPQALLDLLAEREGSRRPSRVRRLAARTGERVVFVSTEDVDWVEAAGNYVILHVGNATHILRDTMGSLEEQLSGGPFMRVSRSAILNLQRVKELQSVAPGEHTAILLNGQRVTVTRSIREVEERLRSA
jgi:two-component system LytT family response regulator